MIMQCMYLSSVSFALGMYLLVSNTERPFWIIPMVLSALFSAIAKALYEKQIKELKEEIERLKVQK